MKTTAQKAFDRPYACNPFGHRVRAGRSGTSLICLFRLSKQHAAFRGAPRTVPRIVVLIATLSLILQGVLLAERAYAKPQEQLLDAVVASVDGSPITLQDIEDRLAPPRSLELDQASRDEEAQQILDALILEEAIVVEAKARNMVVVPEEIESYMDKVAAQNSLSRSEFEDALAREGRSLSQYKNFVRVEILKSKLMGDLIRQGAGVTEEEIASYLEEHPELTSGGAKVKINRIFIAAQVEGEGQRTPQQLDATIQSILAAHAAGARFSSLARQYSDGPAASLGGSLGVLETEDMNPALRAAVEPLKEGELSKPFTTPQGVHLFHLERWFIPGEDGMEDIRSEVRAMLADEKLQVKMESFFTSELLEEHTVDRKI